MISRLLSLSFSTPVSYCNLTRCITGPETPFICSLVLSGFLFFFFLSLHFVITFAWSLSFCKSFFSTLDKILVSDSCSSISRPVSHFTSNFSPPCPIYYYTKSCSALTAPSKRIPAFIQFCFLAYHVLQFVIPYHFLSLLSYGYSHFFTIAWLLGARKIHDGKNISEESTSLFLLSD